MRVLAFLLFSFVLSSCSLLDPLVYKIDIPQGNYLEQKDVDKLRIGMSQEQVKFILGSPVAQDMFRADVWHYVYHLKPGKGKVVHRELNVYFQEGKLTHLEGDLTVPESFYTPLEEEST